MGWAGVVGAVLWLAAYWNPIAPFSVAGLAGAVGAGARLVGWLAGWSGVLTDISIGIENVSFVGLSAGVWGFVAAIGAGLAAAAWVGMAAAGAVITTATGAGLAAAMGAGAAAASGAGAGAAAGF
ncbi:hypothetical protein AUC43_17930 [Hymenobacter sedentarius]|uniref:Uncharacterized protein n=1 Tax=Hymenobacter sedentarius TaxID=1411621 RepID=A0A0U4BT16_9BACT|nr:hypothetical protein AUC43_17930 [Hymenobacter sedentarius]